VPMNPLMQSTLRLMRPEELARIQSFLHVRPHWAYAVITALATALVVWVFCLLASTFLGMHREVVLRYMHVALGVTLVGSFAYHFRKQLLQARRSTEKKRQRYAADLAAQQIEEWRVRVVDAIEVEEFEDEGRQCYLELEDGRVLFLSGQYLYDDEDDDEGEREDEGAKHKTPRFPNRELLITRLPHAGDVFDLQLLGDHFPPSVTLPPFTRDDHEQDRVPEDGQILPGPLLRYATR
jgi:hypothetical protein